MLLKAKPLPKHCPELDEKPQTAKNRGGLTAWCSHYLSFVPVCIQLPGKIFPSIVSPVAQALVFFSWGGMLICTRGVTAEYKAKQAKRRWVTLESRAAGGTALRRAWKGVCIQTAHPCSDKGLRLDLKLSVVSTLPLCSLQFLLLVR